MTITVKECTENDFTYAYMMSINSIAMYIWDFIYRMYY